MAKGNGGSRKLTSGSKQWKAREKYFNAAVSGGEYSDSYFSKIGGGYVLVQKSPMKHSEDEYQAAIALADNGYQVILLNEAGSAVTKDGKLITIGDYEQRTPQKAKGEEFNAVKNMGNALRHARDKKADIAVIYMKNDLHTKESVDNGIKEFEKTSKYRFSQIVIVTKDGRIHRHYHNK